MIYLTPEEEKKLINERRLSFAKFLYESGKPIRDFLGISDSDFLEERDISKEVKEKGLISVLCEQLKEEKK